jgi:hypothetical protein
VRKRVVSEEFWESESLGRVSVAARLTFVGLWQMSDDVGVFKAQPGRMRRALYFDGDDVTAADVAAHLAELEAVGCIVAHDSPDGVLGVIPKFLNYQKVNRPSGKRSGTPGKRLPGGFRRLADRLREDSPGTHGALSEHPSDGIMADGGKASPPPVENPGARGALSESSVSAHAKEGKKEEKDSPMSLSFSGQCGAGSPRAAPGTAQDSAVLCDGAPDDGARAGAPQGLGTLIARLRGKAG